jgi:hypothetical protein
MKQAKPRIVCKPGRNRPIVLILPGKRNRSFSTFAAAIGAAEKFCQRIVAREFNDAIAAAKRANQAPAAPAAEPVAPADLPPVRRFRVRGTASDLMQSRSVDYTVSARGRGAAVTAVSELLSARGLTLDSATARMLPAAKSEGSAAKSKRTNAVRSSRRRAQRSANETRVLRNAGLSPAMAEKALKAAAGKPRIAPVTK